jgi:hypothetical protein
MTRIGPVVGIDARGRRAIACIAVVFVAACSSESSRATPPVTSVGTTTDSSAAPSAIATVSATAASTTISQEANPTAPPVATTATTTVLPTSTTVEEPTQAIPDSRSITYVGAIYDEPDLSSIEIGSAGYWLPQFNAPSPAEVRPTDENAIDRLPEWVGPLNHFSILAPGEGCSDEALERGCRPGFGFRTFSQDGPATSSGGRSEWSTLTTPDGATGISGAIVDPHTDGNSNNTVNRIQLEEGVPLTFYVHVIADNTAGSHDPTAALRARGNIGLFDLDDQVEPDVLLEPCDLLFNGVPDIYTFRFDGFAAQDYVKLRLSGTPGAGGASFAGFLFDETFNEAAATRSPTAEHGSNPLC